MIQLNDHRPILDAGPGLNFFSLNKERLLFSTLGPLAIPEHVESEMRTKARSDQRFRATETILNKVPPKFLQILSDDPTEELSAVIARITQLPMSQRIKTSRDLGEIMVIGHAVVAAESGDDVIVLIDDQGGRRMATLEQARLDRLRHSGRQVGSIKLIGTVTVLEKAAGGTYLPDRGSLRALYQRMRRLDDGLIPLEQTGLLNLDCW